MEASNNRSRDVCSDPHSVGRWTSPGNRLEQVSQREQRHPKSRTPQVEVVTNALLASPLHPTKQAKSFSEVSQDNHHEKPRANYLQKTEHGAFPTKVDDPS
jgi:hypothetical protein